MSSMASAVYQFTAKRIEQLAARPDPAARAALAELRRGVGRKPGELPRLWGEFLDGMPEEMYSISGTPSRAEWAVYTALTLYALHQQSKDLHTENMNRPDVSFGRACAGLVKNEDDRERIWKRLYLVCTSGDMQELGYRMRGLIQLLRNEGIGLDYPSLAADLYRFQSPEGADAVRLKWGQDFYKKQPTNEQKEDSQ